MPPAAANREERTGPVVRCDNYPEPVLSTDQKGAIAETAIVHEATRLGIAVFKPVNDGGRCDMIFDVRGRLIRVQCKWATRNGDVIGVRCYSSRRSSSGQVKRPYTSAEIDAFAAYCGDLARCYFLPIECFSGRTCVQLRLAPARNNQKRGINWADEFEFAATLGGVEGP